MSSRKLEGEKEVVEDVVQEASSSDSDDDEDIVSKVAQLHVAETAAGKDEDDDEKFEREVEEEHEQLQNAFIGEPDASPNLDSAVRRLRHLKSLSRANFQDLLPLLIDGRKFVIDGDSLLMLALDSKGLSLANGGQTLHVIYLVEKFLLTFLCKGVNFVIVFFQVYDSCWNNFPQFNLVRSALRLHLMKNQKNISVFNLPSFWSEEFATYIQFQRPNFVLMLTSLQSNTFNLLQESCKTENEKIALKRFEFLVYSQAVCSELLVLQAVDIVSVQSTAQCLMGTVHTHSGRYKKIQAQIMDTIHKAAEVMPAITMAEESYPLLSEDVRQSVFILSVASVIKNAKEKEQDKIMKVAKVVLLYAALLENTPLRMRCFKKLQGSQELASFIPLFQREMAHVLNNLPIDECSKMTSVTDLWHGQFLEVVLHGLCELGEITKENLGVVIGSHYEQLVSKVNELLKGKNISPYPLQHFCEGPCATTFEDGGLLAACKPAPIGIIPTTSKLVEIFSGDIKADKVFHSTSDDTLPIETLLHSQLLQLNNPMTDQFDRIRDSIEELTQKTSVGNKRFAQSGRNALARYTTVYGMSLEGRNAVKAIVTDTSSKGNQKAKKPQENQKKPAAQKVKQSKKDKIIEDNLKRKSDELQKQIKERLKSFSSNFTVLMQKGDFREALGRCDIELQRAGKFSDFVIEILFYKAKACFGLWVDNFLSKQKVKDLSGAKELFLVIREILQTSQKSNLPLSTKQKNSVSAWLYELGFKDIASIWALPEPSKSSKSEYHVGFNYTEFQLAHLGADLIRETDGRPDPRADGFVPDQWQIQLFDIIDKNQSALVVAPTSSGKTYASYYCMEKVIRESDDSIVIYVCPTKALVNQVYATIYARFKKTLPPGKVLLGSFLPGYRQSVMNCQILTTVPECLEILLLSPKFQTWVKRIKYVIFDEVHCLAGHSGGLSWENCLLLVQCPYLALSATIHEPETFCAWMQRGEDFKKKQAMKYGLTDRRSDSYQVSLVVYSERHNHLKKNIMMPNGSIKHVHPYSFLDPATLEESNGVPQHISLSPDETLELYQAMTEIVPSPELENLCPEKYFKDLCPSGFLSMQAVKKFSDELRIMLEKKNMDDISKVLIKLQKGVDYENCQIGDEYVYRNISLVLDSLKTNGMLPALVFSHNRSLVRALPVSLLRHLRAEDDFTEDEDTDIPSESEEEDSSKKASNKNNRRFRGKRYRRKLGLLRGPSMLKSSGSLRGEGFTDEKVMEFIEKRLMKMGYTSQNIFPCLLRRGLGHHFEAMNNRERGAVEMLFRLKVLNLVAATGTLALGIHMPCKAVVIAGDTPDLNPLEFHQMAGRAGRRGYDKEGNVILYGLHKRKMQTLITGNLPKMRGNFPLRMSLILRLLQLTSDDTLEGKDSSEMKYEALIRTSTLLENSLLYESCPELRMKMKVFFYFVIQFFIRQGLTNLEGHPKPHAQLLIHLHHQEPGNFAFNYLLNHGVLEGLCKCNKDGAFTQESLNDLMIVLNFLFARLPLSHHLLVKKKLYSLVVLPSLPEKALKGLQQYNEEVVNVFSKYFECITAHAKDSEGEETCLPLSKLNVQPATPLVERNAEFLSAVDKQTITNKLCSVFPGLSGITDYDLFPSSGEILHVRDDVSVKVVPTIELEMQCNSYALDFYQHGMRDAIAFDNGLKSGVTFELLEKFMLTLEAIHESLLEILDPKAKLLSAIKEILGTFSSNFLKAYPNYR